MEKNIHAGHRARVKREFLCSGFNNSTPPHKILELLLFFCLPQGDTNPLAHQLIDRYESLAGVLDAPVEELITFKGLTESNVVLLKLVLPIAREYMNETAEKAEIFNNVEEVGRFLQAKYFGYTKEVLSALYLTAKGTKQDFRMFEEGDIASVGVPIRLIVEQAMKCKATNIVIAHNHPAGLALPSEADAEVTRQLARTLDSVGLQLSDHIILSGNDYVSLRLSRDYNHLFFPDR